MKVIALVVFLSLLTTIALCAIDPPTYRLYGMDYPYEEHYKQIYVIAQSEQEALSAARDRNIEPSSVRRIDVPILIVR